MDDGRRISLDIGRKCEMIMDFLDVLDLQVKQAIKRYEDV